MNTPAAFKQIDVTRVLKALVDVDVEIHETAFRPDGRMEIVIDPRRPTNAKAPSRSRKPRRYALYRHFDKDGALLYVGISRSAAARLAQHSKSPWDHLIARVDVESLDTRQAALKAERKAITTEKPIYNVTHNK